MKSFVRIVIRRVDGRFLVLREPGRPFWNFPGGKVEHDEEPVEAARRELAEETSLDTPVAFLEQIPCGHQIAWVIARSPRHEERLKRQEKLDVCPKAARQEIPPWVRRFAGRHVVRCCTHDPPLCGLTIAFSRGWRSGRTLDNVERCQGRQLQRTVSPLHAAHQASPTMS